MCHVIELNKDISIRFWDISICESTFRTCNDDIFRMNMNISIHISKWIFNDNENCVQILKDNRHLSSTKRCLRNGLQVLNLSNRFISLEIMTQQMIKLPHFWYKATCRELVKRETLFWLLSRININTFQTELSQFHEMSYIFIGCLNRRSDSKFALI